MTALTGVLIGAGAATGLLLILHGVIQAQIGDRSRIRRDGRSGPASPGLGSVLTPPPALAPAGLLGAVGWLATGWPAVGVDLALGVLVVARGLAAGRRLRERDAMATAVAGWAEMMADVMRSHAALIQAVGETADLVPPPLGASVRRLAARAGNDGLADALERFDREVGDPSVSGLVASLRMAMSAQSRDLPSALDRVARRSRARAEQELRVMAGRARLYSEARAMVVITLSLVGLTAVVGRDHLQPYADPVGQVVLMIVGGMFAAGGWVLVTLGEAPVEPDDRLRIDPRSLRPRVVGMPGRGR